MTHATFILLTLFAAGQQSTDNDQSIAIKQTQAQRTVYIQYVGPYWTVGPVFRTMGQYMADHDQTGPMYARYEANPKKMRPNKMRSEIGFWIEGQHEPQHPYKSRMQESEQVAYEFVDTANPNIAKQYEIMTEWIRANDYEPVGPITEIHHRALDHAGADKLTVEIQMPLRKKQQRDIPNSFADRADRTNKNQERTAANVRKYDVGKSNMAKSDKRQLDRYENRKPEAPDSIPAPAPTSKRVPAPVQPEERIVVTPRPKQKETTPISPTYLQPRPAKKPEPMQIPHFVENFAKQDQPKPVYQNERPHTPPRTEPPTSAATVYTNPDIKPLRPRTTRLKESTRVDKRVDMRANTIAMTITELIEANEFDRVAELIMPNPESIAPNHEIWFGQIVFRFKAVARGMERMYPGEGGSAIRLVNALSSRYEIIATRFEDNPLDQAVVRTGTLNDPTAPSRRELMRTMDSLLGKLAVKQLSADEFQEEVFDVIDRLYDITRDR